MIRYDLLTQEAFEPSRINQKFISPQNRIRYYNNKANELRHEASSVNRPLFVNHKILNELLADKKEATYSKEYLLGKGMNFRYHTNYVKIDGKNHFAIYQYVILLDSETHIKIIKND